MSPNASFKDSRSNILSTPSLGPKAPPKVIKPIELGLISSSNVNQDNEVEDLMNQKKQSSKDITEFGTSSIKKRKGSKHITIAR